MQCSGQPGQGGGGGVRAPGEARGAGPRYDLASLFIYLFFSKPAEGKLYISWLSIHTLAVRNIFKLLLFPVPSLTFSCYIQTHEHMRFSIYLPAGIDPCTDASGERCIEWAGAGECERNPVRFPSYA